MTNEPDMPCYCPDCGGLLFHVEPRPKYSRRKATDKARYAQHKPKTHVLCVDCVADIHRLGWTVAPPLGVVRWRRTDDAGCVSLCQRHKDLRVEAESDSASNC